MNTYTTSTAAVNSTGSASSAAQRKLARVRIGFIVSIIGTLAFVICFINSSSNVELSDAMLFVAFICSIVSYILAGGFAKAITSALALGKIGWFIVPFPIDIATGIATFGFALLLFLFMPVFFVYGNYRDARAEVL